MKAPVATWKLPLVFAIVGALVMAAWLWNLAEAPRIVSDDAFVFMRYARNWVDHGQLAWNVGEAGTDGFTSFGYQAWVALCYLLGPDDIVAASWIAAVLAASAVVLLSLAYPLREMQRSVSHDAARDRLPGTTPLAAAAAVAGVLFATAASPVFAYWTHALMDVTFVSLAVLLASFAAAYLLGDDQPRRRPALAAGVALALLWVTRPEGMLVVLVLLWLVTVRLLLQHRARRPVRPLALALAVAATLGGAHFAWHLARFGHAFPNPVYVKTDAVDRATIRLGLRYLADGPAHGLLPSSLSSQAETAGTQPIARATVRAAIATDGTRWAARLGLALGPLLLIGALSRRVFRDAASSRRIVGLVLPPLGMLALTVLAGGDRFYGGWRMITPVMPALLVALACAVPLARDRRVALALAALAVVLAGSALITAPSRPARCSATLQRCGWSSLAQGPTTSATYEWDVSHAGLDRQFANAVRDGFPADTVVAQTDFLRIGVLLDNPIVDLSGLVNAALAHGRKRAKLSLFDADALLAARPDIYVHAWSFVGTAPLADHDLGDADARRLLAPWPPPGTPAARAQVMADYVGASLPLADGRFFNFLLRRDRIATLRPGSAIRVHADAPPERLLP